VRPRPQLWPAPSSLFFLKKKGNGFQNFFFSIKKKKEMFLFSILMNFVFLYLGLKLWYPEIWMNEPFGWQQAVPLVAEEEEEEEEEDVVVVPSEEEEVTSAEVSSATSPGATTDELYWGKALSPWGWFYFF
jgi:hypothetical protein